MEGEAELCTSEELHNKQSELGRGTDVYTERRLKDKLKEHYGDHVFFATMVGSRN